MTDVVIAPSMTAEEIAQANFNLANDIAPLSADEVFRYDAEAQRAILRTSPWKTDPHYFKKVRISAVALIKMVIPCLSHSTTLSLTQSAHQVMHARSGGAYEIMGLMQGKLDGDTMVVMDAFALPVTGTETRVNAQNDANEFMIQYITSSPAVRPFLLLHLEYRTQYAVLYRSDDWRIS